MIPAIGEVYKHRTDGWSFKVVGVHISKTLEIERVDMLCDGSIYTADAAAWAKTVKDCVRLTKAEPTPDVIRIDLVGHITRDLQIMQALSRQFAMGVGDHVGEDVVVLVARGPVAKTLKEIGLRIHRTLIENEKAPQDPKNN